MLREKLDRYKILFQNIGRFSHHSTGFRGTSVIVTAQICKPSVARFLLSTLLKNNFLLYRGLSGRGKDSETWSNSIVPLATHALLCDVELLHLVIGHLLPFLKGSIQPSSSNRQPGLSGGAANIVEHDVQVAQRFARPIQADLAKEPMLDRMPFRTPSGIMAHGHAESIAITELLLQMELKAASPRAITASGIRQDQELFGVGKALSSLVFPPASKSAHGKLWCIG
jgi:hypothetical protein